MKSQTMKRWYSKPLAIRWIVFLICLLAFLIINLYWYYAAGMYVEHLTGGVMAYTVFVVEVLFWPVVALVFAILKRFAMAISILIGSSIWLYWYLNFRKTFYEPVHILDTPLLWIIFSILLVGVAGEIILWSIKKRKAQG